MSRRVITRTNVSCHPKPKEKKRFSDILVGFVFLFFITLGIAKAVMYLAFDIPQAATKDGGETISYFLVPTDDWKGERKVTPDMKEFAILMDGIYDVVHVVPNDELEKILREEAKQYK